MLSSGTQAILRRVIAQSGLRVVPRPNPAPVAPLQWAAPLQISSGIFSAPIPMVNPLPVLSAPSSMEERRALIAGLAPSSVSMSMDQRRALLAVDATQLIDVSEDEEEEEHDKPAPK